MNKVILISCINSHSYGGYSYWNNLIPSLIKSSKKLKVKIKFICNEESPILKYLNKEEFILVKKKISDSILLRFLYEQFYLPFYIFKKHKCNFYFNAKNIAPLFLLKKSIIAIRNVEPFYYKKSFFSKRFLILFLKYFLTIISLKKCFKIISVSKNTSKIIKKYTDKEIITIPNGVSVNKKLHKKWKNRNTRNFILNSSKIIPYANQLNLLKIYSNTIKKCEDFPILYFVGGIEDQSYYKKILQFIKLNNLQNKVKFFGYLSKADLNTMMSECKLFAFSSEMESCPQTILEARLIGCPIFCSNIEPMPEFLGKYANYFNPNEIEISEEKLIRANKINKNIYLKDTKFKHDYDWDNIIKRYIDIFNSC